MTPQIVAHRGAHDGQAAMENKLSAFVRALELGVDMVECDLQLSSDGRVVVIHDDTLDRTTTARGRVRDHTAAQLQALGVPTLADLCQIVRGRAQLLAEIKSADPIAVHATLAAQRMLDDTRIFSFHLAPLHALARHAPSAARLAFLLERFNPSIPDPDAFIDAARSIRAGALAPRQDMLTPQLVEMLHAAKLHIFTWTPTTDGEIQAALSAGIDGLITDRAEAALTIRHRNSAAGDPR